MTLPSSRGGPHRLPRLFPVSLLTLPVLLSVFLLLLASSLAASEAELKPETGAAAVEPPDPGAPLSPEELLPGVSAVQIPGIRLPRQLEYRGLQLIVDGEDARRIAGTEITFGARRRDGGLEISTAVVDEDGRFTLCLDAENLPEHAPLAFVIVTPGGGVWFKRGEAWRIAEESTSNAVAWPWFTPSEPSTNVQAEVCASPEGHCAVCGGGCTTDLYTGSQEARDHGVSLVDGTVITRTPVESFDSRLLGFGFTLFHHSMTKYPGPVGEYASHSYNMVIVQRSDDDGLIVTPDLRVFSIRRQGTDPEDPSREIWEAPEGFYSRLVLDRRLGRWILTHHEGCEFQFVHGKRQLPGALISLRDPNGNRTRVRLDPSGLMDTVVTDLEQTVDFGYDGGGRLSTMTDHLGRSWRFGYDEAGNLGTVTTPETMHADVEAGEEITDTDLPEALTEDGRTTTFSYDDPAYPHHITRITDPRGAVPVEVEYEPGPAGAGRVRTKRINGRDVRYLYDPPPDAVPPPLPLLDPGNRVTRVIDREGNVVDYEMHGGFGGPLEGRGRWGLRRRVEWTETGKGHPPLRAGEPRYWERRWLQDCDCLAPQRVSQPFPADAGLGFDAFGLPLGYPRELYQYNDRRQITVYEYVGFGEFIRWEKTYDSFERFSRPLTHLEPRAFDDSPVYTGLDFLHRYTYDERGNRTRHDAPTVTRGTEGPQAITETWTYNRFGQRTSHTDPNGNVETYDYFPGDFETSEFFGSAGDINTQGTFGGYQAATTRGAPGSADPVTALTTSYRVNALGRVTRRTDPKGLVYETEYNDLQESTRELDAEVTLANGARVRYETRHVYDGAGNRVMTRRSNVDSDGTGLPGGFIDRSYSFDAVNNLLSSRVEVDDDNAHDLVSRYTYDRNDQLAVEQQPEGNRSFHLYDERRLHFKTFYGLEPAAGGSASEGYPADKRAEDLPGTPFVGFTATTYDARRNATRVRDGRGNPVDHIYDFYNRRVATSDQNGNGRVYRFDDASNVLTEEGGAVSKATGQATEVLERSYGRYDEIGRRYQQVLDIELDGDESAAVDPDDGRSSSYETVFDAGSRVVRRLDAEGNPTSYGYDAADRTLAFTDALGNVRSTLYDDNSNVVRVSELELPGPGAARVAETYVTTYVYDELNRRTESHVLGLGGDSIDHETSYRYDSRHNTRLVEDAEGNFSRSTFDDLDRLILTQRFDGDPGAAGVPPGVTELIHYEYRYDANSRKTADIARSDVADPASEQVTRYAYDDLDRLVRTVYPDSDDPIDGSGDGSDGVFDRVEVAYDANSNVTGTVEQRGVSFANIYDPGNRLTVQTATLPPEVPGTTRQEYAYDPLNRLTAASNDYARVGRGYDPLSRLTGERQEIRLDGSGFTAGWERPVDLAFEYDRQSNRTRLRVEGGAVPGGGPDLDTRHSYDALNRVDTLAAAYFERPLHEIADYTYLGPWRVAGKRYGNGVRLTDLYDVKRRLAEHAWRDATPEAHVLVGFQYGYDDVDNPLWERFLHDGGLYDNYGYNDRYELTGVTYRSPAPADYRASGGPFESTFGYDDNFNRREASFGDPFGAEPNVHDVYAINKANEYTRIDRALGPDPVPLAPPLHDAAGNMTRLPVKPAAGGNAGRHVNLEASWDAFNLLFTARVPDPELTGGEFVEQYRYDPFRRRIAKFDLSDDGCTGCPRLTLRRYIYDGWSVVEERTFEEAPSGGDVQSVADRLERIYVNGRVIDEPLLAAIDGDGDGDLDGGAEPRNTPDGTDFEYFYLNNRLGSVMGLVDAGDSRRVLEFYRYEVYGGAMTLPSGRQQTEYLNVFTYAARRSDLETGLYYLRNRYFETSAGTFVSRDTLKYSDTMNFYSFARNSPVIFLDPWGLLTVRSDVDVHHRGKFYQFAAEIEGETDDCCCFKIEPDKKSSKRGSGGFLAGVDTAKEESGPKKVPHPERRGRKCTGKTGNIECYQFKVEFIAAEWALRGVTFQVGLKGASGSVGISITGGWITAQHDFSVTLVICADGYAFARARGFNVDSYVENPIEVKFPFAGKGLQWNFTANNDWEDGSAIWNGFKAEAKRSYECP